MLDPNKQIEIDELVHKLADGSIGPFEFQRLNDLLMHDRDAQRHYLHHADLVNTIRWQLTGEATQQSFEALKTMRDQAPKPKEAATAPMKDETGRGLRLPSFDVRYAAAAAIVLAVTLVGLLIASKMNTAKRIGSTDDYVIQPPTFPLVNPNAVQVALIPRVEQHRGDVHVAEPGAAPVPVQIRSEVKQGQTVETRGVDSSTVLAYTDKTSIVLANDTTFTVEKASQKKLTLDEGSMAANVSPQPPTKPMLITTPHAEIQVLGTRFSVETESDRTKLSVTEGKVRIRLIRQDDGQWVEVPAGSYALAEPRKPVFVQAIPNLPETWTEDFEVELPAGWDRGVHVKGGCCKDSWGSVKAERIVSGGMVFYQISSQIKRSDGEGLFQIHEDTHIHLRVKTDAPGFVNFYLATKSTGPIPDYSNYLWRDLDKHIKKHSWYEVTIPIHVFQRQLDANRHPTQNDLPFQIVLGTGNSDRNLTVDKIWVTRGGPGFVVSKHVK